MLHNSAEDIAVWHTSDYQLITEYAKLVHSGTSPHIAEMVCN